MAHFVQLDENNVVINGIVVNNDVITVDGNESEEIGIQFCHDLLGGKWLQTSYNGNFRKQYAGIGFTYNPIADVFIAPQPYPSWILDENFDWQAPTSKPLEGFWRWNEDSQEWVEVPTLN